MKMKEETKKSKPLPAVSDKERAEWRKKIFSINNPKLLDFIYSIISARQSVGHAENRLDEKPDNKNEMNCFHGSGDKMFKPFATEDEDPDNNG
jgi:hypothetical protein